MTDRRNEFLLEVYRQCSAHLDRHVLIPWQSVGVIGAALAVFLLKKQFDSSSEELDYVLTVAVLLCAWLCANLYDANNWFDRNLHIIANVERQFLSSSDLKEIHPFFGEHRFQRSGHKVRLLRHFMIQLAMTIGIWVLVLAFHYSQRLVGVSGTGLCSVRSLPYVATVLGAIFVFWIRGKTAADTAKLFNAAPGKPIT